MNTKAVKSFGLALMLAAGVLAVLLALGTFSPQKAGAQTVSGVSINPDNGTPGAALSVRVNFTVADDPILAGNDVKVELPSFTVPVSIDKSDVLVRSNPTAEGADSTSNNARSVVTDPDKNTITVKLDGDVEVGTASITFDVDAGIKAPTASGDYLVEVDDDPAEAANAFSVARNIEVSPGDGDKGTVITVSGTGFGDGTASIYVDAAETTAFTGDPLDTVTVSGGAFETTITIAVDDGTGGRVNEFVTGTGNTITVVDPREDEADRTEVGTFTLTGKVTVSGDLVLGTKGVKVGVVDGGTEALAHVTIGGVAVPFGLEASSPATRTTNGAGESYDPTDGVLDVVIDIVGDDLKVGDDQPLELLSSAVDADPLVKLGSTTVNVNAIPLTLSPATVIQGNRVTALGSGFGSGGSIGGSAGGTLTVASGETSRTVIGEDSAVEESVAGGYAFSFTMPDLPAGEATVTLTQNDGKVGTGTLTVSAPTITVDPADGRVGSTIAVEGTGFPAKSAVHVTYGGEKDKLTVAKTVTVAVADANGEWSTRFATPAGNTRGPDGNNIQAFRPMLDESNGLRFSNVATHVIPASSANSSPDEGLVGDIITVTGEYYDPGLAITIKIGGSTLSETGAVTDANGDFSIDVAIPDLAQRFPVLTVDVGDETPITKTIEILEEPTVEAPVSRAVADVLADLAGNVQRVFIFHDDGTWSRYSAEFPELSNLTEINAGDCGWINLTEAATYQGRSLGAPWALHCFD